MVDVARCLDSVEPGAVRLRAVAREAHRPLVRVGDRVGITGEDVGRIRHFNVGRADVAGVAARLAGVRHARRVEGVSRSYPSLDVGRADATT